jgi:hypothetical protein
MRPKFSDLTILQNRDIVGHTHSAKAVRNQQAGATVHQLAKLLVEFLFLYWLL